MNHQRFPELNGCQYGSITVGVQIVVSAAHPLQWKDGIRARSK